MKTTLTLLTVLWAISTTGALGQSCSPKHPICDTNATQAAQYMINRFGQSDWPEELYIDSGYTTAYRVRLERREHYFKAIYRWAQTLPPDQRSAWEGVLDSYMEGVQQTYVEWHTHDALNQQLAFEKHERECAAAARHAKKLPTPPDNYPFKD